MLYMCMYIYTHVCGHVGCVFVCVPMCNMTVYYKKYLTVLFYTDFTFIYIFYMFNFYI